VIGSSEKHLVRIYDALKQRLLSQSVIHGDETTVQVLKEKDRKATDESYIWAYRSGKDSLEPVVLLEYQPGRGQVHPQTFLGDYRGILMSDGYQGWRTLKGATHVGCMAHARRRFVNAFKAGKKQSGPPAQALKFFDQLYRIERQVRDEKPDDGETQADCIRRLRQKHSVPVLDALKEWLDRMAPKVVPDTKLGDAISYTRNQWQYLTRYTEDGRMPIDNNLLERDIRVFARRVPLCTPSLSDCKHWKGTAVNIATRAACSGDRRLYRLRLQIGGPYLVRSSRDNLLSRKDASLDTVAYHVV
jgi:hypothetical protein